MLRAALILAGLLVAACSSATSSDSSSQEAPAGTLADPVDECRRAADVCRLDGSRLGVCIQAAGASAAACEDRTPCFVCMSQH